MEDRWNRLEEFLETNIPAYASNLGAPATENAVEDAERETGLSFPPSVRQSYLIHNGEDINWQRGSRRARGGVLGWPMHPLKWVVEVVQYQREIAANSTPDTWDDSLIPIFLADTTDYICVRDAPDGAETPVIYWNHEAPDRLTELAPSFPVYVDTILDALEAGDYEYHEQKDSLRIDVDILTDR